MVMATEANKSILADAGLLTEEAKLPPRMTWSLLSVPKTTPVAEAALQKAEVSAEEESLLRSRRVNSDPKPFAARFPSHPAANVAVISVAGRYAADEAWDALSHGLHVLLFSDNVSLEDEIALKKYARDHGLLLMGPGAGTTILNDVALGFANVLPRGPVGIVSAAGTGLQEVSTLLARRGVGITPGHWHGRPRPEKGSRRHHDAGGARKRFSRIRRQTCWS